MTVEDVFPAYELSVAALTFILGFVSARHHARLASARDLITRLGSELAQPTSHGTARDRADELVNLAEAGTAKDAVVSVTLVAAVVVDLVLAVVLVIGLRADWFGAAGSGAVKGVLALALAMLVTGLGIWDAREIRLGLLALRDGTTVGLVAQASRSAADGDWHAVLQKATAAATRNPAAALPLAYRAQAWDRRPTASQGERAANLRRRDHDLTGLVERDQGLAIGLLDRIVVGPEPELPEPIARMLGRLAGQEPSVDLVRRRRSILAGAVRRSLLGAKGEEPDMARGPAPHEQALHAWRYGDFSGAWRLADQHIARHDLTIEARTALATVLLQFGDQRGRLASHLEDRPSAIPDDVFVGLVIEELIQAGQPRQARAVLLDAHPMLLAPLWPELASGSETAAVSRIANAKTVNDGTVET
jgi:hypothetical protein